MRDRAKSSQYFTLAMFHPLPIGVRNRRSALCSFSERGYIKALLMPKACQYFLKGNGTYGSFDEQFMKFVHTIQTPIRPICDLQPLRSERKAECSL